MSVISAAVLIALVALTLLSTIVALRVAGERKVRTHNEGGRPHLHNALAPLRTTQIPFTPPDDDDDTGIEVHEYESALDAAEVLLDMGHAHGAAEVLSQFIEEHPKQAVMPWLKLMDIYRKAGAKNEYDTIARGLNQHFNIHALSWHQPTFRQPVPGLEAYPHVIEELTHRWGTHACHHYLGRLLADNRGGSRSGFCSATLDEILLLTGVLETAYIAPLDMAAGRESPPHPATVLKQRVG